MKNIKNPDNCVGNISAIQRYSTKDGPGIRSTVFCMGCNLNCKWCSNPELIENSVKIMSFENKCKRCGACMNACDRGAISMTEKSSVIDRVKCDACGKCIDACPYDVYEKVGFNITPADLSAKLLRDKAFYDNSGGGVTFSGGEPALQPEFIMEIAKLLKENGVSTALDTAGLIFWENLKAILKHIDLVLYDLKAYASNMHLSCTGADNTLILENARKIADMGKRMVIRIPVVSGLNNSISNMSSIFYFVKSLGSAVEQVDILNYHNLAEGKYMRLGLNYMLKDVKPCPDKEIEAIIHMSCDLGLKTTIGG